MNKILTAVALLTFGSVAAQAADGRDPTLAGQPAQEQVVVEGRNAAVSAPVASDASDAAIKAAVEADARSTR